MATGFAPFTFPVGAGGATFGTAPAARAKRSLPEAGAMPRQLTQTFDLRPSRVPPAYSHDIELCESSAAQYVRTPVEDDSLEHKAVMQLLSAARLSSAFLHVQRVCNARLVAAFHDARRNLLATKTRSDSVLEMCGIGDRLVEKRKASDALFNAARPVNWVQSNLPEYNDNCALLFHCSRSPIATVLEEGLDLRLSNSGLLGKGIYFTDDARKAMLYDTNSTLFIFVVILGDCLHVHDYSNTVFSNAVREPAKSFLQMRNKNDLFFDSIVSQPKGFSEYVIFNTNHCYPLYTISYDRSLLSSSSNGLFQEEPSRIPYFAWTLPSYVAPMSSTPSRVCAGHIFKSMEILGAYPTVRSSDATAFTDRASELHNGLGSKSSAAEEDEECGICFNPTATFIVLKSCPHKMCQACFTQLHRTGTTMSGVHTEWLKCPWCNIITHGVEIGSCPDGTMTVQHIPGSVPGFPLDCGILVVNYLVSYNGVRYHRIGYFPATPEGQRIVSLLKIAFDRRVVFAIGTSATTGRSNAVVWAVHHKTRLEGGISNYAYPDPGYLDRVALELKERGVV
ncbi:hypothetical protein HDU84_007713 [Entophlyctis sp. JEL0112]|nr:hypothetical protein HDU84_007713 [Entophlyctis sp. JEL0112]